MVTSVDWSLAASALKFSPREVSSLVEVGTAAETVVALTAAQTSDTVT